MTNYQTHTINSPTNPKETITMDPRQFRDIVASDVKGRCTPAARQMLDRHPGRWLAALEDLLKELDRQRQVNETIRTDVEHRIEQGNTDEATVLAEQEILQRERNRAEFERHVRIRLGEIRALHLPDDRLSDAEREAQFLRRAIVQHRAHIDSGEHNDDTVDGWLYAALDGRWDFPEVATAAS